MSKDTYTLRVAEQPNADGFYVDEVIRHAKQWVDDDRGITYETITL